MTTYEHVKFRGPVLGVDILCTLFSRIFSSVKVPF